jgi:hypothetical protein
VNGRRNRGRYAAREKRLVAVSDVRVINRLSCATSDYDGFRRAHAATVRHMVIIIPVRICIDPLEARPIVPVGVSGLVYGRGSCVCYCVAPANANVAPVQPNTYGIASDGRGAV